MTPALFPLFDLRRPLSRGSYATSGILLFLVKWNIDRALLWGVYGVQWFFFDYFRADAWRSLASERPDALTALLTIAIPFALTGALLTLRRLRTIGAPLPLTLLFFMPYLNLALFAGLSLRPPTERRRSVSRST